MAVLFSNAHNLHASFTNTYLYKWYFGFAVKKCYKKMHFKNRPRPINNESFIYKHRGIPVNISNMLQRLWICGFRLPFLTIFCAFCLLTPRKWRFLKKSKNQGKRLLNKSKTLFFHEKKRVIVFFKMIAFDFVGQLGGGSRWVIALRSYLQLARFIDCSSSRLFLEETWK